MDNVWKEIKKANEYIDKKLKDMNADNRGEKSLEIVLAVRNLNDNVALKIFHDLYPEKSMGVNKAASQFFSVKEYRFISKFDFFLQKSVSHFTPSEDGAERLMIKYYNYLIQLKQLVYSKYGVEILTHINNFLEDLDEQTNDYYKKVASKVDYTYALQNYNNKDIYYIYKTKPFIVNKKIYYEVTLELASDKTNKFDRITAFTNQKIDTYYATELNIVRNEIDIFGTQIPILIITNWDISIRPCELNNFSKILGFDINIQRSNKEYKEIMNFLKEEELNLVDIVTLPSGVFEIFQNIVESRLKNGKSTFIEVLKKCKYIIDNNIFGRNIISYLLYRMNNKWIKDQWPNKNGKRVEHLYLSTKCKPFENLPFSFEPKNHIANFYDILYSIGGEGRKADILARYIRNNTINNGILFTSFDNLNMFGNKDEIIALISEYNKKLYKGFKPGCELSIYKEYVYKNEFKFMTIEIINKLKKLSVTPSKYSQYFTDNKIENLKSLHDIIKLDDPFKENILKNMFSKSSVHLIYGPAGTGKTRIVNHINNLMVNCRKVFLAKTHAAVMNLKQKVNQDNLSLFLTIEKFLNQEYKYFSFDMIVVDECSTVKNEEILEILEYSGNAILVLVGDIYQIEAIGYGNWFKMVKNIMPTYCCHELKTPFRTTDENLKKFWDLVRNMDDDNIVVEEVVKHDFSLPLSNQIFTKYDNDEIILCLNYNGLYGLNNINKLMQLSNPNPPVDFGVLQYKIGDPILFNDSNRFSVLYNNLKGKIIDIIDKDTKVKFKIEVYLKLEKKKIGSLEGLKVESVNETSSIVSFIVRRNPPYSSDNDEIGKEFIMPFQVAYAVSIHKSQGLEYNSVKIVIADDSENMITHNIFYTAVTRAREKLMIYWSPEVCNRILKKIRHNKNNKDINILLSNINNKK